MTLSTTPSLTLRDVTPDDLPILFEIQRDPDVSYMAAFTARDPSDRAAFDAHWEKLLADDNIDNMVIVVDGEVVGSISSFEMFGERNVGYSLAKAHWGKGYATQALTQFLKRITRRPLYGRVASDNIGSRRVLEKCGFTLSGQERAFAEARGQEIDELILILP